MFKRLRTLALIGAIIVGVIATTRIINTQAQTNGRGGAGTNGGTTAATTPIEVVRVDRGDVAFTVNATGSIQATQNVSLAFPTNGKVTAILVKEGDYVRKGQTIATLDNQAAQDTITNAQLKVNVQQLALTKLNEKARQVDIDVAQAQIAAAKAQLSEAGISPTDATQAQIAALQIEMAKNQLWQAQLNRDANDQKREAAKGNVAASMPSDNQNNKSIDSATAAITIAQDQLKAVQSQGANIGSIDSAQASLTAAQISLQNLLAGPNADDLKQAQANLDSAQTVLAQAQADLSKYVLVAPFDGLIAKLNINVGEAAPSAAAAIILDVSSFYVDLPIAEIDIAKIKTEMPVDLRFDALPNQVVAGKVIQISDTANTGTPVTYNVRVQITPAGQKLLTTMSTTASIITSNTPNVIRLPNRLIRLDTARKKAYATVRQADGTFKEVELTLGAANDTYTEIKSGLNVGDTVITPQAASANGGRGGFGGVGVLRGIAGG